MDYIKLYKYPFNSQFVKMTEKKWVYNFTEGKADMKALLGGKGANLCDMTKIGLPVPPGFTITTEVCDYFYKNNKRYPQELQKQVDSSLAWLENQTKMKFGDSKNPLLVSVRSGAAASMPGMMDTILNLGLNEITLKAMIEQTKNERFCLDSFRRFIQMFGDVVIGVDHDKFEEILEKQKHTRGISLDTDLNVADLRQIVSNYKALVKKETGKDFPQNVKEQLMMAVNAVFGSWNNPRAITYRRLNDIKGLIGTAVNVQAMVFGNMGNDCATGVAFTRNPSTGENKFYGEYLINAQGEDVVAGIRTPQPVDKMAKEMPAIYKQLLEIRDKLEKHYKDMQDIEFTIQKGKLYMLQTRNGKRTGHAAVKIAVELVKENLLTKEEALMKVDPAALDQLLHKRIDPFAKQKIPAIARGLPASPGAAVGKIVFNAEDAKAKTEEGEKIILVRIETSPEDIEGMHVSQGILTARGGMTSHAAVVARGMGKCCVAGCSELQINEKSKTLKIKDKIFKEGDYLTLDGSTGEVFPGQLAVIDPILAGEFATLMKWARETKKLGIRTNADTPKDAKVAKDFGAEGIGLTRTEHMFFEGNRITSMREMILADNVEGRKKALAKLLPFQRQDFEGIFEVMTGLPVIIRFLDPPLHEFLPKHDQEKEIKELATLLKITPEKIKQRTQELHEFNPMLGFRGCRLGIVYPEISEMQARAVFEAALNCKKKGINAVPEIEIPNIIALKEFKLIKDIVKAVAKQTGAEGKIHYKIGTMIEFPRAAFVADELATEAEFMSFGTNDLTQTTLGFSRDDAGRFIPSYVEKSVFEKDPFQTIDQEGVGKVMKMAITKARSVKPTMDIGICGEHGGDPASVKFCHKIGLSNVSCSPYRVPIATLAAAQASIEARQMGQASQKTQQKQNPQNQHQPHQAKLKTIVERAIEKVKHESIAKKPQQNQTKQQPKPQQQKPLQQKQNPQKPSQPNQKANPQLNAQIQKFNQQHQTAQKQPQQKQESQNQVQQKLIQENKPQQQKQNPKKQPPQPQKQIPKQMQKSAISIQDEIKRLVKQELSKQKR
jgi:pyruvate,orthophosphate dikinase